MTETVRWGYAVLANGHRCTPMSLTALIKKSPKGTWVGTHVGAQLLPGLLDPSAGTGK